MAGRGRAIGIGPLGLGLRPGDGVAILAEARPEWALADYACLCAGAIDVPIYPTLPANQAEYILHDSGALLACCSTSAQLEKLRAVRARLPALRQVIAFDAGASGGDVITLADVEARGRAAAARHARFQDEALFFFNDTATTEIYTSGTTGQ